MRVAKSGMENIMFEPLLDYIEQNIHEKISNEQAAACSGLSVAHLHRLFKFAYGMTTAEYIRKRKLSESLSDLLEDRFSVLETALSYGFEHEQSFTRAFKAEFGMTPGKYRKERPVLSITPPICSFGIPCSEGLLFGPELVMLPELRLVGVEQNVPYLNSAELAPIAALDFWDNRRHEIINRKDEVYYGLTHHPGNGCSYTRYLTAVEVKGKGLIPKGMTSDVFGGCPCVKFHYIGMHHYRDISQDTAKKMYEAIGAFFHGGEDFPCVNAQIHLEKIDSSAFDGTFCLMEWFAPVIRR